MADAFARPKAKLSDPGNLQSKISSTRQKNYFFFRNSATIGAPT